MFNIKNIKILLLLFISLLFMTCDPGLGKAVDTQAPKVSIDFPETKSVLKGDFVIKGVASDEVKVEKCEILFRNIKTSSEYIFSKEIVLGKDTFSLSIKNSDGNITLPDGDYQVTVKVSDAYRFSTADIVYTIDNTAPTVLIQSPNSYSESNWPNIYKTIDIKGEVYDANTIEKVTVYLVDKDGKALSSMVADGTNTFSARFELPFDEDKLCFYYVVAQDVGKNVNTYFYHRSDISKLLSLYHTDQSKVETFPSINNIGYVDQGQKTNLTELINDKLLESIKIENTAVKVEKEEDKEVYVFPGFNYYPNDVAQIKWLNITADRVAGIQSGSPVLGTIMPPTDNSAINYASVKVEVYYIKDGDTNNTNEDNYQSTGTYETCVVKEGEEGDKSVKLTAVGESLNFQILSHPEGSDENWKTGKYKVCITFSTEGGNNDGAECFFEVTSGPPRLNEENFSNQNPFSLYYRGYMTASTLSEGKNYLSGKSLTSDETSKMTLYSVCSYIDAAGNKQSTEGDIDVATDGSYKIDIPIDVENHTKDGEYTYTLTSNKGGELTTELTRVVVVDTIKPIISFNNLNSEDSENPQVLNAKEITIAGNVEDTNGITKTEYMLFAGDTQIKPDCTTGVTGWTLLSEQSSFNLYLTNLVEDVIYSIKLKSVDKAGNESIESIKYFTIDLSLPIAEIVEPKITDENSTSVFVSEIPTFSGNARDDKFTVGKKPKAVKLEYKKDDGDFTEVEKTLTEGEEGKFFVNESNGTWSWKPTNEQLGETGTYEIKLSVTDIQNTVTANRIIRRDVTPPTIKINSITPQITFKGNDTVNGTITVSATVADGNSIKNAYYTFDSTLTEEEDWSSDANKSKVTQFTSQEITNGIAIKIDTTESSTYSTVDGVNYLKLRIKAVDVANNYSIVSVNPVVNQESDIPIIAPSNFEDLDSIGEAGWSMSGGQNVFTDTNPNMIFTLSDDDSVKEYYVKVNDGEFTKIDSVNSAQKIMSYSVKDLSYDRHTITFRVIDINYVDAKSIYNFIEKSYYIAIDDKAPELKLKNADGQYVGSSFVISGTATDGNEIESVTLQPANDEGVYTTLQEGNGLNADGSFSYTFNVPDVKDTIRITAVDKIGHTTSMDLSYYVDSSKPTVETEVEKLAIDTSKTLQTRIEGIAFDNEAGLNDNGISGIDQVLVKIGSTIETKDDEGTILASGSFSNDRFNWNATLDFTGYLNTVNVYVCAFDKAGNKSDVIEIETFIDSEDPDISHEYTNNDLGIKTSEFVIEGTATDTSGIASVTAKVEGSSTMLSGGYEECYWNFTVPTLSDGTQKIIVTATDTCGRKTSKTLTVEIDTVAPVISFTNIEDDGTTKQTNSSPSVNISYSDATSGIESFEYAFYYKSSNDIEFTKYSDSNAEGSFECGGITSDNIKINMAGRTSASNKGGFITQNSETDGQWKLYYKITDKAEHVIEGYSPIFIVDRHVPVLEVKSPNAGALKKKGDALTVSGTVVDNYGGTIDRVNVQVTHPSYTNDDYSTFSKTFTFAELTYDAVNYLYTWNVDWPEVNSPFKYSDNYEIVVTAFDTAENQYEIKTKVSCDNTAPIINFTKPYSYKVDSHGKIIKGEIINSPIGFTSVNAIIDDFSMEAIYYQIGGTANVTSTGTKGKDDYKITCVSVEKGGIFSGEGEDFNTDNLKGVWKELGEANNGFTAEVDTLKYFNQGITQELLNDDKSDDANVIQTLEIHLVAIDEAGNMNYCAFPIKVDTDTDKPELLLLSPKTSIDGGATVANVGGTTTISGTVADDNCVHSVWLNVELVGGNYVNNILTQNTTYEGDGSTTFGINYSEYGITSCQSIIIDEENKTFSNIQDDIFYFTDKSKWYKVNLGEQAKSTTWNIMLNKNGEFDIGGKLKKYFADDKYNANEETQLIIRTIALDVKDDDTELAKSKLSDITSFNLKIDSGSPSIIFNNLYKIPVEGSYIGGTIEYDLTFTDDGNITYWSVTAKGNKGELLIAEGSPNEKTVNEVISIDTSSVNDECGNVITLKFYAEDNSKDASGQVEDNKTSEESSKFTIDNSAPIASTVETINSKTYLITTESVVGDATGEHRESEERGNHLRIKSESALLSGKVSDEMNGSGVDYVMLYFTKEENSTSYVYNPGVKNSKTEITDSIEIKDGSGDATEVKVPFASFSDVDRNNNSSQTTPYIIIDKAEGLLDSGSNGDGDGYDENLKANGEWMVQINSTNLPDGVYDITYLVIDVAGNARYYSDTMLVQNSAPTITSIVLSTDIDGDGLCESTIDGSGDEDSIYRNNFENTDFVVRNEKLQIRVNVSGGTAPLKYFLRYTDSSGNEITTDENTEGYETGIFTITSFPSEDGNENYTVWVEDSVEANLSLSSEVETIGLILDNNDEIEPVAQLFELNTIAESSSTSNEKRGSLFTITNYDLEDVVQGHIEPRDVSNYNNDTSKDPDVSGKIILRGEALDDQRIENIILSINGTNVTIASWNESNHTLLQQDGKLERNELGLLGHYVEWSYVWDTNSIAKPNVSIKVTVTDHDGNSDTREASYDESDNVSRTSENLFSLENWGYNSMFVDVVPYINNISRNTGYVTKRSRSGAYPLLRSEEENIIEGFNLTAGTLSLAITSDKEGSSVISTMEDVSLSSSNVSFTVPDTAKDGYLHLTVNGVPAVNNINKRDLPTNVISKYWTDDCFIRIWQDTDRFGNNDTGDTGVILAQNPAYPAMSMSKYDGTLYASYTNYSMHNVYYTTIGGESTAVFNGFDSPEETTILVSYDDVVGETKINVAYMGNYQASGDYENWHPHRAKAGGLHLWDNFISSAGKNSSGEANATAWSRQGKKWWMTRFELLYHDKQFQQFKNFRLARKDGSNTGNIHVAYYDIDTMSIHYSVLNGSMEKYGTEYWESSWVNIDGEADEHDIGNPDPSSKRISDGDNVTLSDSRFEGTTRTSATGEYVGIDLTNDTHYPVLAYYDSVNLKLARANKEVAKYDESCWTIQRVITDSNDPNYTTTNGNYVDLQIDDNGYVHVVFVNGRGELIYVKSTNNPNDGNSPYVFGKSVVIAENSPMNVDITVRGVTPYIGYLTSLGSFDGLNTAFYDKDLDLDNDGIAEGGWETMSAPLTHAVSNNRASVEAHPNPSTSNWESAHAYYSGGYYRVAYYIGNGEGH